MSEVMLVHTETKLLEYFQWLRLNTAKKLNDLNIESSRNIKETKRTFSGTIKNIGHFFERGVKRYDKKDESINDELLDFSEKHPTHISKKDAMELVDTLFMKDTNGLTKLLMSISIILDNEYTYTYEKEGLEEVSNILYGNKSEILTIKKQLENNYNAISPKTLSATQKGMLMGVALVSLASVITLPILLGAGAGASASATTAALAAHGFGDMQIGLGVITAESLIMSAALTGIAYGGMKLYNSEKVKQEFKELNPEKNALYLATQCTFIQRIKTTLDEDEFKETLDCILKNLETLKQDLDYYLFIENETTNFNKQKIKSFHEFDNRLMKILDL